MITKIHAYLVKEVKLAENAEEKSAEFVNRVSQVILEAFWTQTVKGEEGFDWTDSMLEGLGAGWTSSFLAKVYPSLSRYLIREFLQAVTELSIEEILALFVTFGAENFVRIPVSLLNEGVQNLRLDGLLTLIAITHGIAITHEIAITRGIAITHGILALIAITPATLNKKED